VLHVGDASVAAVVVGGTLDVVPIGADALPQPRRPAPEAAFEANLEVAADPAAFRELLAGRAEPGSVTILAGEAEALARFMQTFRIDPVDPSGRARTDVAGADASAAGDTATSVA
jgi:hypothetical protein